MEMISTFDVFMKMEGFRIRHHCDRIPDGGRKDLVWLMVPGNTVHDGGAGMALWFIIL